MRRKFILGIFDTEEGIIQAAQLMRDNAISIYDVFTPMPIHALDKIMGLKRSWLPIVCFLAGLTGCLSALGFQIWAAAVNWPLNVGGKPFNSFPAFMPITFEVTVLISGLVTTAAFLFRSRLFPLKRARFVNQRVNDDRFVIVLEEGPAFDEKRVTELLKSAGALLVERESEG